MFNINDNPASSESNTLVIAQSQIIGSIIVYLILLIPTIIFVRPEDFIVSGFVVAATFGWGVKRGFSLPRPSLSIIAIVTYSVFGLYFQIMLTPNTLVLGDVLEVVRPVRWFVIIATGASLFATRHEKYSLIWYLMVGTLISIIFALLQAVLVTIADFDPMIRLIELYGSAHIDSLQRRWELIGTSGNPNSFMALLGPGLFISVAVLVDRDGSTYSRSYRLLAGIIPFLTFFVAIMTRSRIGIVILLAGATLTIIITRWDRKTTMISVILLLFGYLFLGIGASLSLLPHQFAELLNPFQARAMEIRFDRWTQIFRQGGMTPLLITFGHGPQEMFIRSFPPIDSGLVHFFFQYGVFGTFILLNVWLVIFINLIRVAVHGHNLDQIVAACAASTLFGYGLMMLTANPWKDLQLLALLGIVIGSGLVKGGRIHVRSPSHPIFSTLSE